jgi:hypothetical protein
MKKKTVKKLVLSKETVRELTDDLGKAAGATFPSQSECPYMCDVHPTLYPTCIA